MKLNFFEKKKMLKFPISCVQLYVYGTIVSVMYHTRTIALEMPNPTQIRKRSLFLQHVPLCTKGIKYRLKLSNMVIATRRGVVGPCKCGVGRCRICNSSCKRCKCDCDGISPRDALERGRSCQKGYSKAK